MGSWFERRSIRSRIVLLMLAILLPVAALLAWALVADLGHARASARETVRLLAAATADDLQHLLDDSERLLTRLAQRPQVRAMDAGACDLLQVGYERAGPGVATLTLRNAEGRSVCSLPGAAWPADADPLATAALPPGQMAIGGVQARTATGTPAMAWRYPVADESGTRRGVLVLEVDLLALNRHLLSAVPGHALVAVTDAGRTMLLRSAEPATFIGQGPAPNEPDPMATSRDGYFEVGGRDGVRRVFAHQTLPGSEWRVVAGLPVDEVYGDYRRLLVYTVAVSAVLALAALGLAWRLSAAIVRPLTDLGRVAARVAAGAREARGAAAGPPEVRAVAATFNRMLEARDLSEARLRGIFTSAVDAVITTDEQQVIVEANPAAAATFRCRVEDMVGAPLERFIPPRFREVHRRQVQHFGEDGVAARPMGTHRVVTALRADGVEFPIEASISRVQVGGRRLFTVIHRDVTERRRAEAALHDSEARLRRLLTYLPEAVFVNGDNRISFANPAALALFGTDAAGLLGRSPLDFIHPDSHAQVRSRIATLLAGAAVAPLADERIVRADGVVRQVQTMATLIQDNGSRSILVVMRDVTELQRAQAELQASHADLTRLVAALDRVQDEERRRIARELHDDLQQILAAIRMDIGAAADRRPSGVDALLPLLSRIDGLAASAVSSTRRIINDLRPEMLEELGLVAALDAMASRFAQRHGLHCTLTADEPATDEAALPPDVAGCLFRVAQEALNNVAKHAQARRVWLTLSPVAEGRVRLSVEDDGCGIAPADLRKPQSFGLLGMKERLRAFDGSLRVQPRPGGGTTLEVEVALPR